MKIVLLSRFQYHVLLNKVNVNFRTIPNLTTPHIWFPWANAIAMVDDEISVGKYRMVDPWEDEITLSKVQEQISAWTVEPIHPEAKHFEDLLRRGEFEDEVAHE